MADVLSGPEMKERLTRNMAYSTQHAIGQTRKNAEAALQSKVITDGWTVTFHDEQDHDAYCLAEVRGGELVVLCKTYGELAMESH